MMCNTRRIIQPLIVNEVFLDPADIVIILII